MESQYASLCESRLGGLRMDRLEDVGSADLAGSKVIACRLIRWLDLDDGKPGMADRNLARSRPFMKERQSRLNPNGTIRSNILFSKHYYNLQVCNMANNKQFIAH